MTYEQYLSKRRLLEDEIKDLEQAFIDEHKPCDIGSRIILKSHSYYKKKEQEGECVKLVIDEYGTSSYNIGTNVSAVFSKIKQDGTPNGIPLYIWSQDSVTFIKS